MPEPVGVLAKIAAAKREELEGRFDGVSLAALRAQAERTGRSLADALSKPGARFILEIKKVSPSEGAIRAGADPAALARGYAGVADALSVLCDRAFFGGSLDDLTAARSAFDGPILAKDFFIDLRQVPEARIAGRRRDSRHALAARRCRCPSNDRRSGSARHGRTRRGP